MVKNGNDLVPCNCDKCKGVPRNRRTERAHRAARRKQETEAQAGTSRFSEWYQAQGQRFATAKTGSPDLEEEDLSSDSSLSNARDSEGSKRPKKRPRVLESAVSKDDIENSDLEDPLGFDVEDHDNDDAVPYCQEDTQSENGYASASNADLEAPETGSDSDGTASETSSESGDEDAQRRAAIVAQLDADGPQPFSEGGALAIRNLRKRLSPTLKMYRSHSS